MSQLPRRRPRWGPLAVALCCGILAGSGLGTARAQPWTDDDGVPAAERIPLGRLGLELRAEHRAEARHLDEIDLAGTDLTLFEQRLRADLTLDDSDRLRLVVGVDALDGIPWGTVGTAPQRRLGGSSSGIGVLDVDYVGPAPADAPEGYGLTLVPAPAASLRRAFGEIELPFARLRVGRRPAAVGMTLLGSDGEARRSRFGLERGDEPVDGLELGLRLPGITPDPGREERGLGLTLRYDRPVVPDVAVRRAGGTLRLLAVMPRTEQVFDLRATAHARFSEDGAEHGSELEGLVALRFEELSLGFDGVLVSGRSDREARGLAPLLGLPSAPARIRAWGTRSVLRWDTTRATAYLELATASGDARPEPSSELTRFVFPRNARVGLLLFEHVLAYASARTAAAGAAALTAAGVDRAAADAVATRGAFTSAVALFPQIDLRPHRAVTLRGGLLLAWAPEPLVDPVRSLADGPGGATLGLRGGTPGGYYGTELDARVRWSYRERCLFEVEGALLDPGPALADAAGRGANAALLTARTTLVF